MLQLSEVGGACHRPARVLCRRRRISHEAFSDRSQHVYGIYEAPIQVAQHSLSLH